MKRATSVTTALTVLAMLAGTGLAQRPEGSPRQSGRARAASPQRPPMAKDEAEQRILGVLDEMYKERGIQVPTEDGRLLRLLTEAVGAKHVVEIGTYRGYSAIWLSMALRTTGGKLTTFERDAQVAAVARENFKRAGVDQLVTLIVGDAHQEVAKLEGPIDVVFIDADKAGYVDYLNKLLPLVRPGGLILAHNVPGTAPEYVEAVTTNPDLETVFYRLGNGVGLTLKKR